MISFSMNQIYQKLSLLSKQIKVNILKLYNLLLDQ
jgi:hypothetical protein